MSIGYCFGRLGHFNVYRDIYWDKGHYLNLFGHYIYWAIMSIGKLSIGTLSIAYWGTICPLGHYL